MEHLNPNKNAPQTSLKKVETKPSEHCEEPKTANRTLSSMLTHPDTPRASWKRPLEFSMACLAYAIGLGNVWRFPYLAYRNGGGAFLIPFFIMLVFLGFPLFFLELYVGQYSGLGPIQAFSSIAPCYSGLGACTLVVMSLVNIYYMVIVAWILLYVMVSLTGNLQWGSCENSFNTINCYSGSYDTMCRINNTNTMDDLTYYHRNCTSIKSICLEKNLEPFNSTHCLNNGRPELWYTGIKRVLATSEYYNEFVLGRGDSSWEDFGSLQWHLVGTLFLSWLIAFICVGKGIHSSGKVVYFMAIFPYVMLTILLVRGVTLEGAGTGVKFYLLPKWSVLARAKVWGDAASQVFYSFGVACGSLVTLSSYNNFYNNCHADAVLVSLGNFFTSIYAGFAIFSVLGFQAMKMGVGIDDVAESGPGLAFVVYPAAILQMSWPALWSVLFFFMLFILGLGCQFAGIEAIATAIIDKWPQLRTAYWKVTSSLCFIYFLLGIPMCFSGGVYLLTVVDWNTASWGVLILGMLECVAVSWSRGMDKALKDLYQMKMKFNRFFNWYWVAVWKFIVPFGSIAILIFVMSDWTSASYDNYVFPWPVAVLGWAIGLSTLVFFPVGILWAWLRGYRGKELFKGENTWRPSTSSTQTVPRLCLISKSLTKKMMRHKLLVYIT